MNKEFEKGWWNCFCSFAGELVNVSSNASMVIRGVLDGAGVTRDEVLRNLRLFSFDERVRRELEEYADKIKK